MLPRHGLDQAAMLKLLGYNLAQASIPTNHAFRKHIAPLGLTQVEFTVLMLLATNANVTQLQLGRALGAAPSNLTNLLGRLEAKHLIQRRRSSVDARAQTIALTRSGAALAKRAAGFSDGMEENLLRHLSEGERHILFELLQKVARFRHA
ncbi:MAG TPA: MarR family winged helix-turn-helix transcriptional regulator [Burkholderiaceae bacterium]|nr:MarR family winged helix-turn-helix transcriptional regulator [Burkholderiaceae bacterium]